MTILDACVAVLSRHSSPMTSDEIYKEIIQSSLYEFRAKDPKNMVKSALRKHLRSSSKPRVIEIEKGLYKTA